MKALDIVKTPKGAVAIVSEVSERGEASIHYIGKWDTGEKSAWWSPKSLAVIDNLPHLLSMMVVHPFSSNKQVSEQTYPVETTEIVDEPLTQWISERELHMWEEMGDRYKKHMQELVAKEIEIGIWGTPEEKEAHRIEKEAKEYKSHLKFAWVYIDGKKQMIMVHNENMKGYKLINDSYMEGLVEPLEEQPYQGFDRWCTGFDL